MSRFAGWLSPRRVPMVFQNEAAECGLACMAMIAAFHGHRAGLRTLRQKYAVSMKGITLARLAEIADALNLRARAVRLELDDLASLDAPAILHWNLNHFVVLTRADRKHVWINDPAMGELRIAMAEAGRRFTGIALLLEPGADFTQAPAPPAPTLAMLTGPVRGIRSGIAHILLVSLVLQAFALLLPFQLQWTVDTALLSADRDLVVVLGIAFLLLLGVQVAIALLRGWTVARLATVLGTLWQANAVSRLLKLPVQYFERRSVGDVVSRLGSVQAMQRVLSNTFVESVVDGLMALVACAVMFAYSKTLFLVSAASVGAYVACRGYAFRALRAASQEQIACGARQQGHLLETIRGMQSIKVAGAEVQRFSTWSHLLSDTMGKDLHVARLRSGFVSLNQGLFGAERILVIWGGASLVLDGALTVGMLMAYLSFREMFSQRAAALVDRAVEFGMVRMHAERLGDVVLSPPSRESGEALSAAGQAPGFELRDVSFRYAEGEPWVLRHCSLRILPGESVAITGPSGAGKTTLLKILLGLLDPSEGIVLVNGRDLAATALRDLYRRCGVVMQDDQLFAGSIRDNVAFFDDACDETWVREACCKAGIHDDIMRMPMGYQTLVGDMGSTLSGGQKQRVLLARALYKHPDALFLDEATSHLDVSRERSINEAIRDMAVTRVIVAHRPETVASADRVVILRDGGLLQAVGHEGLPASGPVAQITSHA